MKKMMILAVMMVMTISAKAMSYNAAITVVPATSEVAAKVGFYPTFSLPRHSPSKFGLCSRLNENVVYLPLSYASQEDSGESQQWGSPLFC